MLWVEFFSAVFINPDIYIFMYLIKLQETVLDPYINEYKQM